MSRWKSKWEYYKRGKNYNQKILNKILNNKNLLIKEHNQEKDKNELKNLFEQEQRRQEEENKRKLLKKKEITVFHIFVPPRW